MRQGADLPHTFHPGQGIQLQLLLRSLGRIRTCNLGPFGHALPLSYETVSSACEVEFAFPRPVEERFPFVASET